MAHNFCDLTGKIALVTGASRGLGQYMAAALAKAGADLAITSRTLDSLKQSAADIQALGRRVLPVEMDLRDVASIRRCAQQVESHFGRIDILVNNAGCNVRRPALDVTEADWDTVVDTNLKGTFFMAQAAGRGMVQRRYGRIINIGSVTSVMAYAGLTPYCASRGGVKQMTMSLADDWGPHGVTVNCLAPGWFKTAQTAALYERKAWIDYMVDRIPLKRVGEPHDLDGTVVFLASDASAYITGQTILVDGGITTGAVNMMLDAKNPR